MSFSYSTVWLPSIWKIVFSCLKFFCRTFKYILLLDFFKICLHTAPTPFFFACVWCEHFSSSFPFIQLLTRQLQNDRNLPLLAIEQHDQSSWGISAFHRVFLIDNQTAVEGVETSTDCLPSITFAAETSAAHMNVTVINQLCWKWHGITSNLKEFLRVSQVGHLVYLFTQQCELLMSLALYIGPESDEGGKQ